MEPLVQQLMLIAFVTVNVWGLTNGSILLNFLRHIRRKKDTFEGFFEASVAMSLNCASLLLLILESIIWPSASSPTTPVAVQITAIVLLFLGSFSVSFALHRIRAILMGPRPEPPTLATQGS